MKSVSKNRIKLLKVKKGADKKVVLTLCVLLFSFQFVFLFLPNNSYKSIRLHLKQSPDGLLSLSRDANHLDVDTLPELTPFFFEPIPINSCDKQLLQSISGIGPALATKILLVREQIGNFTDMNDLLLVPGIGKFRMAQFSKSLSFKIIPISK
jgi:competence ComEA-like helix-hairpin-helix protein